MSERFFDVSTHAYAHRGLWGAGIPENSLAAFEAARAAGVGVELDVRQVQGPEREELCAAIARYKGLRDRLHRQRTWLGEAGDHVLWQAVGAPDAMLLIVTRTDMSDLAYPPLLRLPMVDPARRYRIAREGKDSVEHDGAWLLRTGFALPRMPAEAVRIFEVTAL